MPKVSGELARMMLACWSALVAGCTSSTGPTTFPLYDHIVIVVEENKDFDQIIGNRDAPYINKLAREGTTFTRIFAEEHFSQGNYFWLFSGDNQKVGFYDQIPRAKFTASNLGEQLIKKGLSFKGYSQSLPSIGSEVDVTPPDCRHACVYARKHVPWISFANLPNGTTLETSSNLRFADFPSDYNKLPTVAFVVPDMEHDMHNGAPKSSIPAGDQWLQQNIDPYYQWAKTHNSLLILTFDENDDKSGYTGLTDPAVVPDHDQYRRDLQNRIVTIFAGAHVKPGHTTADGMTHVNLLRTIEAIYG
jgi:acid phosphatase